MKDYYAVVDFTDTEELDKFYKLSNMTEEEKSKFDDENIKLLIFNTVNGNVVMYINMEGNVFSSDGNFERLKNLKVEAIDENEENEEE